MPIPEPELYEQDAEFCRYQDNLRWSRFQTATVLQAAVAYVVWELKPGYFTSILVAAGGLFFIFLLWWVSQVDESDYSSHLERIKKQEERCPDFPFERKPAAWVPRKIKGRILMPIAWVILLLFDILLLLQSIIGKPF